MSRQYNIAREPEEQCIRDYHKQIPQALWQHWPWLLLPAISVGLFEYVRHSLFHDLPLMLGNLIAAGLALLGSIVYYMLLFRVINRLNDALHRQIAREQLNEMRNHIADDLHDSLAQTLFFANVKLRAIDELLQKRSHDEAHQEVRTLQQALSNAYGEVRQVISELKEASQRLVTLLPTLRQRVTEFQRQTGLNVQLTLPDIEPVDLPQPLSEFIVSAVQETLWNAGKHGSPSNIDVHLTYDERTLTLTVRDDGIGFDPSLVRAGFGLTRLRERAEQLHGSFQLQSSPGQGTTVRINLPIGTTARRERPR